MAPSTASPGRAVIQFAVAGVAALLLLAVVGVVVSRDAAQAEAVADARRLTSTLAHAVVAPALSPGVLAGDAADLAVLDAAVRSRVLGDGVLRVKVWSSDGRILYSDEPRLIGSTFPLGEEEQQALAHGRVAADVSDLAAPENRFERGFGKVLEVYLPMSLPGSEPVLFETYSRYQQVVSQRSRAIWGEFIPITIGLLLLLQLVQLPLAGSLAARLQRGREEREGLLTKAITASDGERRRIAGDLHDGVVQDLAGVSYALVGTADRVAHAGRGAEADAVYRAAADVRQSIRALRSLLVEIYPPNLRSAGLAAALSDLVAPLAGRGIAVQVELPGTEDLPFPAEALIFRVAQEAVRNAVQHARAGELRISVHRQPVRAVLQVEDDGIGFDPSLPAAESHVGLRLLADLAGDAGARLHVASRLGSGTRVRLEVPLP